jgi:hypothetical protein
MACGTLRLLDWARNASNALQLVMHPITPVWDHSVLRTEIHAPWRRAVRVAFLNFAFVFFLAGLANAAPLLVENESIVAKWDPAISRLTLTTKPSGQIFIDDASLSDERSQVRIIPVTHKNFGRGRGLELKYPGGNRDVVMLFPKLPFALVRSTLHNQTSSNSVTKAMRTFSARCESRSGESLVTLGSGGLLAAEKNPGSYVWLAVAEPQSRNGTVFGWLTQERGSGVLFSTNEGGAVRVDARIDYGRLPLAPGASEDLEMLAVGYFNDARLGLELWADAVARIYNVKLREQPTGYCTWYSQPHGGAADEKSIATLAEFAAKDLKSFGFSVVQIDDRWQAGWKRSNPASPKKDFRTHDPSGPYPGGMKAAADQIKSVGLVPGLWFMPFAGTIGDPFFDQHLDWFAKTSDGKPYDTAWGGASLDMSHPGARVYLEDVTRRICREWGYQYIKIDGLWTGTATKQLYVNSGYKPDDLGEARFHNPDKTALEIFRDGLKLVRAAAGKDVFILGCNAPQNMRTYGASFGLVDAMRVGPDNGSPWNRLTRGTIFGSRHYFLHRRVWLNDPDPVYVRASMPLNHAQLICSWVALSGQLNLSSEWLPGLPPERLEILKRTMPQHHGIARPVDYFENDPPQIWTVSPGSENSARSNRRDLVGLFNWKSEAQTFNVPLRRLGLDQRIEYIAFDYWADQFIPVVRGQLELRVPGESCVALVLRPKVDHPQVISSSRHMTQGLIDLTDEKWNSRARTLRGRSQLVGDDTYELRVATGVAQMVAVEVSAVDRTAGVQVSYSSQAGLTRVTLKSTVSRDVAWTIKFK